MQARSLLVDDDSRVLFTAPYRPTYRTVLHAGRLQRLFFGQLATIWAPFARNLCVTVHLDSAFDCAGVPGAARHVAIRNAV